MLIDIIKLIIKAVCGLIGWIRAKHNLMEPGETYENIEGDTMVFVKASL